MALQDEILDLASRDVRVALLKLRSALEDRVRDLSHAWGGMDPHVPDWIELRRADASFREVRRVWPVGWIGR